MAQRHGVSRVALYKWKKQLLCKEPCVAIPKESTALKSTNIESTGAVVEKLQLKKSMLEKQVADLKSDTSTPVRT